MFIIRPGVGGWHFWRRPLAHKHDHGQSCGCGSHASVGPAGRDWAAAGPDEVVCPCRGLSKAAILEAIAAGAFTLPLLKTMTGAGRGRDCKTLHPEGHDCQADLAALLDLYAQPPAGWPRGGCGH